MDLIIHLYVVKTVVTKSGLLAISLGRFDSSRRGSLDEASYALDKPRQVEGECESKDQGRDHGSTRSGDSVLERII